MQTVAKLLESKTTLDVCTISPDATVFDAIKVFAEQNLGALIVTENGLLKGLITERDYARKVILKGRSSRDTKVRDIMTSKIIYVDPTYTIDQCMSIMLHKYIRHLPVVEGDRLVGIVSMGDVVKAVLGEREETIEKLVEYITDSPMTNQKVRATLTTYTQETYYGVN